MNDSIISIADNKQVLLEDLPGNNDLSIGVYQQLIKESSGDIYNVIEFKNQVIAYIADVKDNDKNLVDAFLKEMISDFLEKKGDKSAVTAGQTLKFIQQKYAEKKVSENHCISIALFVLNENNMELTYSNAGIYLPPMLIKEDGVTLIKSQERDLSAAIDLENYECNERKIKLKPGDKFLVMNDGFREETKAGEKYGRNKLEQIVEENKKLPIKGIVNKIKMDYKQYIASNHCSANITLLGIEYCPKINNQDVISLTSDFSELDEVKEKVKDFLDINCLEFEKVMIGFHEVLVNAIEHGNSKVKDKIVKVTILDTDDYVKIIVEDEGTGFDWNKLLDEEEIYDNWRDSGRGLRIAELACDSIYYNVTGNKVSLIKEKVN
ncbi:ATP-binding SpoIIE family protein phosphatase [Halanaerobacter jeridensis]|uniref:Anti-sigma regulatory factor (Ser/Thr protein kinase) n=1 Tax=Halanaerobacter jeridensis TaxID=706427 RepID=A0A939BR77_9FIRM|nr:ATP-binding protein [Halanaerobacter jeridensis]MBM7555711.1 anti-sigma regulatory factor (Ser/Thr protein kinase) [Halanaerobacter jeridensis]